MNISNPNPRVTYKPSGVPWLGDMPAHWDVRRAGWLFRKMDRPVQDTDQVVTCFRDGTVTLRKNRRTEGFTESLQEIGYQGIRRGDLVIHQMDAFAGAVGVSDSDGKGTPVYSVCYPTHDADPFYYAHVVREMARNQWILALAKGIRERSTDFRYSEFARQEFPLPPLPEQQAIVRYLDHADRRIRRYVAAKRKLIVLLEEERQAVVNRAVTRGLDPNVRLRPSGVEWLGDVPEHWEVLAVKRRYAIQLGKMLQNVPNRVGDVEVPYLKAQHVQWFRVLTEDTPTMWASNEEIFKYCVKPGDLLVCEGGEGGRTAMLEDSIDVCIIQNALHRVRPHGEDLNAFLQQVMSVVSAYGWFDSLNSKATIAHFTREKFGALMIPLPPLAEQTAIVEYLNKANADIDAAIARTRRQVELIQEYRTRLVADVVTGKLDVREAAAQLPDEADDQDPIGETAPLVDGLPGDLYDIDESVENSVMEEEVTA